MNNWMRRSHKILCLLVVAVLLSSCSSTKLIGSWKRDDIEPKNYQNLGVVLLSPKVSNKAIIESEVASTLRAHSIPAKATFDIFPFAGKSEVIKSLNLGPDELREYVRKRVNKFEFDALLIISLLDEKKEVRYNQGASFSFAAPVYNYNYYGYYSYVYTTIYEPGYYTSTTTYFVESNLYDVATEKLIWTGQTKTKDPSSIEKEVNNFASIIVDEMINKKVLKP